MSADGTEELTQDELFDVLSNARRRYVLEYLSRSDDPVDFQDLTDAVAAWENDTPPEELDAPDRKRVYVSLYQTHLPRLESAGVVTFDPDEGVVELGPNAVQVIGCMRDKDVEPREPRWTLLYGAIAVAGLTLLGLTAVDVGPFAAVPELAASAITMGVLAVVATIHFLVHRRRGSVRGMRASAEKP